MPSPPVMSSLSLPRWRTVLLFGVVLAAFSTYLHAQAATDTDNAESSTTHNHKPAVVGQKQGAKMPPKLCPSPSAAAADRRNSNVVIVSTLDGKVTALDPRDEGRVLWSIDTSPGEMVSSTISQLEMTSNAKWVKLIPSLAGGLYKFDGSTVEAVPLDAETLLRSSFKFADNTVITGGKESRTYGVEMDSGRIRYECTIHGCEKNPDARGDESMDDVVVVKRETQTVRAVEPRTGQEKWNFSVSQHAIDLQLGLEELCDDDADEGINATDDDDDVEEVMKAVVSDGLLCSMNADRPDRVDWSRKFSAPIVHAWRLKNGRAVKIDLFSSSSIPDKMPSADDSNFHVQTPLLYIGTHNKQLYIQESDRVRERKEKVQLNLEAHASRQFPKVSWRPYLISAGSRTPIFNHGGAQQDGENPKLPLLAYDGKTAENTALAVFTGAGGGGYPFDSGLYLYPDEPDLDYDPLLDFQNETTSLAEGSGEAPADDDDDGPGVEERVIQVVFVSLWYWWKEVVFISLLTAFFMNVLITRPTIRELRASFNRRLEKVLRKKPVSLLSRLSQVLHLSQVFRPITTYLITSLIHPSGCNRGRSARSGARSRERLCAHKPRHRFWFERTLLAATEQPGRKQQWCRRERLRRTLRLALPDRLRPDPVPGQRRLRRRLRG